MIKLIKWIQMMKLKIKKNDKQFYKFLDREREWEKRGKLYRNYFAPMILKIIIVEQNLQLRTNSKNLNC